MLQKPIAVIDVGSNSIKLLVAKKNPENGLIEEIFSKSLETRISKGISQLDSRLTSSAIESGSQSIAILVERAKDYQTRTIKIVATSAVRDASNNDEFTEAIKKRTGIQVDVLKGVEEATCLSKGLRCDPKIRAMNQFVQMDIGGGSLELIHFSENSFQQVCSLQLGAVRLTEQFIEDRNAPISPKMEVQIEEHVRSEIEASGFDFGVANVPFIATGGVFKVAQDIIKATSEGTTALPPSTLLKNEIAALKTRLKYLSLQDRSTIPHVPASRADILPVALIIIDTVLAYAGREIVTLSSYNLRYGVAAELFESLTLNIE